jgi:hypothetical protein
MMLPTAVVLTILGIVGFWIWLIRFVRRQRAEAAAAVDELAARLGLGLTRSASGLVSLAGTYRGRAVQLGDGRTPVSGRRSEWVKIRVSTTSEVDLDLVGQTTALGARLAGDVEIGDPEFDRWFVVRTNDVRRVSLALTPDLRAAFVRWRRTGWFGDLKIREGELLFKGGFGLERRGTVQEAERVFEAVVRLAEGL